MLAIELLDDFAEVTGRSLAGRFALGREEVRRDIMTDEEESAVTEKPKKIGPGLEIKTVRGKSGRAYLVFRTQEGDFHVFSEVDAEESAADCGAEKKSSVEQMWESIWNDLKGQVTQ